jgi:hypothetical protein
MSQPPDLPAPVVRRRAGLHGHDARRLSRQKRQQLGPRQLLAEDDGAVGRRAVYLEHPLCQVDPDDGNLL